MEKIFKLMQNVGRAKYVISYHDGVSTHKDGSPFYRVSIYSNKRDANRFCSALESDGYKSMNFQKF